MTGARALETAYVLALFGGYLGLWRVKRAAQRRTTGVDPGVLGQATSPLQQFFSSVTKVLTGVVVALIVAHAFDFRWPGTRPVPVLDVALFNHLGFALGLVGLAVCGVAQHTMGASWRVGIDEANRTELVTTGLYRVIRNPTYLGLYMLNGGLWFIWPTCSVAMFVLAFYLMLEVQVRCEEQHLLGLHGDTFRDYMRRTRRYLPWIY